MTISLRPGRLAFGVAEDLVYLRQRGHRPRVADREAGQLEQRRGRRLRDRERVEEAPFVGEGVVGQGLAEAVGAGAVGEVEGDREAADVGRVVGLGRVSRRRIREPAWSGSARRTCGRRG